MAINYSDLIQKILKEQAEICGDDYVPMETILDTERHHYLLVQVGWYNGHWIYGNILHLDLINGKIYIQQNNSEILIASLLVEAGVPKTDIVLGFHSPFQRQFTEYAVS